MEDYRDQVLYWILFSLEESKSFIFGIVWFGYISYVDYNFFQGFIDENTIFNSDPEYMYQAETRVNNWIQHRSANLISNISSTWVKIELKKKKTFLVRKYISNSVNIFQYWNYKK